MLSDAGWHPGRIADTQAIEAAHGSRGLCLFPVARDFARSFAGLAFAAKGRATWASFDATQALSEQDDARLSALLTWLGEPFSVLGMVGVKDKLLVMSERGGLYGVGEHVLVAYGTDVSSMFERLHTLRGAELRRPN